jgi:hypothetical protein
VTQLFLSSHLLAYCLISFVEALLFPRPPWLWLLIACLLVLALWSQLPRFCFARWRLCTLSLALTCQAVAKSVLKTTEKWQAG